MVQRVVVLAAVVTLSAAPILADFSYQETTTITGGALMSMMKVVGVFSKQAREPVKSEVALHGNKMVHRSANHISIIDLDAQTITSIDPQKKTYSVMTFDDMKRMMEQMSEKMKQAQKSDKGDVTWKASAESTGNAKTINGYNAKEEVLKIEMEGTDKQTGQTGAMVVTSHVWISPDVKGYGEMREFYKRMAAKLDWTPSGNNMFASRPDIAKGMAEAYKEMAKLDGTPVYQSMSMGAEGTAPNGDAQSPAPQSQPQQQQQAEHPSVGNAIGGALGGHFGLGKRKPKEEPAATSSSQTPPARGNASGSLIEMTTEYANFSSAPLDDSQFSVPAGYKKVEPDMKRGM
jgi:hypothetical protein